MTGYSVARFFCSICYIGRIPFAPGTAGSFFALCTWYYLYPALQTNYFIALTILLFFIGVKASSVTERYLSSHDPSEIVIDEWVGQWLSLWWITPTLIWGLIAFIFFRIFDIWKPWPIKKLDIISSGWGVMLDDVAAGIYTLIIVHILKWIIL